MASQRIAENWRYLWGRTGQITAFGAVGDYGFTTIEELKFESVKMKFEEHKSNASFIIQVLTLSFYVVEK